MGDRAEARVHVIGPDAVVLRRRYDVRRGADALLVVRPDGHLGLRCVPADVTVLEAHPARPDAEPVAAGRGVGRPGCGAR